MRDAILTGLAWFVIGFLLVILWDHTGPRCVDAQCQVQADPVVFVQQAR